MTVNDDRRRYERYDPELDVLVVVSNEYRDEIIGLLRDESRGGCAAIFHENQFPFDLEDMVNIETKNAENVEAVIRWTKLMDKRFIKAGFEYEKEIDLNKET